MALWILTAVLLILAAVCFAAHYFFRYTFTRAEKPEPWILEEIDLVPKDRAFFEREDRELLSIKSFDGLTLKGWLYDRGAPVTVILCHGYRGGPEELTGIASRIYDRGMNVLLIYHRAHGLSEGAYFTMGTREKKDIAAWAWKIAELKPEGKIALFGWSMGGNSVMGAVGEELPANVICAVEDCGYENLSAQLLYSCCEAMPKLPAKKLFVSLLGIYCRLVRGFSIEDARTVSLGRCKVPMLFIHGARDKVVPYENLDLCYGACAGKKLRSSYARAIHVGSCGSEKERYFSELFGFIESCVH